MTFKENLIYYMIKQDEQITLKSLSASTGSSEKEVKESIHSLINQGYEVGLQRDTAYIHQEDSRVDWIKLFAAGTAVPLFFVLLKVGGIV